MCVYFTLFLCFTIVWKVIKHENQENVLFLCISDKNPDRSAANAEIQSYGDSRFSAGSQFYVVSALKTLRGVSR